MKKILLAGLVLGLTACGADTPASPTINTTGTWVIDLHPTSGGTGDARMRLTLTQSGATVTGDAEAAYYVGTFTDLYEPFGKVSGTVSGDQYTLNVTAAGEYSGTLTLNGTVVANKLTGKFTAVGSQGQTSSGTYSGK